MLDNLPVPADAEFGTGTNATATATQSGRPGMRVYVVGVGVSANGAVAASVIFQILDSVDGLLDEFYIPAGAFTPIGFNYNNPLRGSVGGTVTGVLPALGASVTGLVSLRAVYGRP